MANKIFNHSLLKKFASSNFSSIFLKVQQCKRSIERAYGCKFQASKAHVGRSNYFRLFSVQDHLIIVAFAYWLMFTIALARVEIK